MAFSKTIVTEVCRKAAFTCCVCRKPSLSLEVHHIVPQKEKGADTINNAAPLCPSCHSDYGGNPEKRKKLREMRDLWYETVENIYPTGEHKLIKRISEDLSDIKQRLPDLKVALKEFTNLRIDSITADTGPLTVSGMISGATASSLLTSYPVSAIGPDSIFTVSGTENYTFLSSTCNKCGRFYSPSLTTTNIRGLCNDCSSKTDGTNLL